MRMDGETETESRQARRFAPFPSLVAPSVSRWSFEATFLSSKLRTDCVVLTATYSPAQATSPTQNSYMTTQSASSPSISTLPSGNRPASINMSALVYPKHQCPASPTQRQEPHGDGSETRSAERAVALDDGVDVGDAVRVGGRRGGRTEDFDGGVDSCGRTLAGLEEEEGDRPEMASMGKRG